MNKSGFTMVELLVVMAISILISGISLVSISQVREGAADDKRRADLRAIQSALTKYYADCLTFPASLPAAGSPLTGNPILSPSCASTNVYIDEVPFDPDSARRYYYVAGPLTGGSYVSYDLCATLTNPSDNDSVNSTACGSNCGSAGACNASVNEN